MSLRTSVRAERIVETNPSGRRSTSTSKPFLSQNSRILVASLVAPSRVVAVALNTSLYPDDAEARRIIDEIARETGLPADDPFRFGGDDLFAAIRAAFEA